MKFTVSKGIKEAIDIFGDELIAEIEDAFSKIEKKGLKNNEYFGIRFDCGVQATAYVVKSGRNKAHVFFGYEFNL